MIWSDLWAALALLLVLEGMLPFLQPNKWKSIMSSITNQPVTSIRIIGLLSMLAGVTLLSLVR